jgi:hypothetical protein
MGRAWKIRKEEEGARILEKRNSLPKIRISDWNRTITLETRKKSAIRNPQSEIFVQLELPY